MNTMKTLGMLGLAIALAGLAPASLGSPAHPDSHGYVGSASNDVNMKIFVETPAGEIKATLEAEGVLVGACVDARPLIQTVPITPGIVQDNDPETGVGAACFPFVTNAGDDTGLTLNVFVMEGRAIKPVFWVACVDVNGDGFCKGPADFIDVCTTGTGVVGSVSTTTGLGCDVFANPSAQNKAIHVLMIGLLDGDVNEGSQTVSSSQAIGGTVLLR